VDASEISNHWEGHTCSFEVHSLKRKEIVTLPSWNFPSPDPCFCLNAVLLASGGFMNDDTVLFSPLADDGSLTDAVFDEESESSPIRP
jgi:hypothetical protein